MNTSQVDPILNQPSSTNTLIPFPTSANAFAEDPAPTPTRFLAECGLFTGTPIISGYSEVNPFEASFAPPARQTGSGTPNISTPNLAVTTVKKQFAKSLKPNPIIDERFSGLHLLADESISTPPLPVFAPSSAWNASSNNLASTKPPSNNAPESTLNIPSGLVSRLEGNTYEPNTYAHQSSAFTTAYDSRAVDTPDQPMANTNSFTSSLSSSSVTPGTFKKSVYAYASLPATMARTKDPNNHEVPYRDTQVPIPNSLYSSQYTGSANYQNGEESASSASPVQNRKRKSSAKSGDKWNPQFAMSSTDKREQKSRSESHDSSENPRNYRDEEGSNASNDEETPEEKRQRFLERNRMAASKCRQKKKRWVQELEHQADEITITNKNLQNLVSQLKEEVMGLKSQLLAHRNCNCNVIQHYVQSSGQFGGSGTFNSNLRSGSLQRNMRLYGGARVHNSAMPLGVGVGVPAHVHANNTPTAVRQT